MNNMQMAMNSYTHNAFWLEDRITITFQLGPGAKRVFPGGKMPDNHVDAMLDEGLPPTFDKASAIDALMVKELNGFLSGQGKPILDTIDFTDTLRAPGDTPPNDPQQVGKYLFTSINDQGQYVPTVICFFKFDSMGMASSSTGSSSAMASISGNGNGKIASVPSLVNFINMQENLDSLQNQLQVPIIAASPTWLTGGSGQVPVGCPLTPPIPVPAKARCSSSPGLWPITLPELPTDLQRMTGDGVHVIILDTLPREEDITRAVEGAEEHNLLLLDVVNNVVRQHNHLPPVLDEPNPKQPKTGKDIKGRNGGGFRMADHGLFIAGIVRDIAPDAHVECIRALSDFCVGDSKAFTKTLEKIQNRMLQVNPDNNNNPGDLFGKQVVINLSCVVPPDKILSDQGMNPVLVRTDLFNAIQPLANLGVIFAASAGNEGDARYKPANPGDVRPDALYPAAFAYNGVGSNMPLGKSMIPVGAVDKFGQPTSYSCFPGDLGIATYGGDVPTKFKKDETGCFTEAEDIDALIGIHTSLSYPALLLEDCRPTYPVLNAHAWAYWSGTSFATPIVAGLVARILQYRLENPGGTLAPPNVSVPQALKNAGVTHRVTWDRLDTNISIQPGQMILAVQCTPANRDDDDKKRERVDIHVTFNE
ncbi:MAG: hypothetical protein NVSMB27_16180 [Ktedonobacteraceae bacterium]